MKDGLVEGKGKKLIMYLGKIRTGVITLAAEIMSVVLVIMLVTNFWGVAIISGNSMNPTYNNGNIKIYKVTKECKREDVVIFTGTVEQYGTEKEVIKRVIAVAGDTVSVLDGVVHVNGIPLQEEYAKGNTTDLEEIVVPEECIYVMGDNREYSLDSREVGFISTDQVIGKVVD